MSDTPQPEPAAVCRKCATADFLAHEEGGKLCTFCARFDTLVANSKKVRVNGATPDLSLTREQFVEWALTAPRVCRYCTIPEKLLWHLDIKTQVGHRLRRLGIDRADNDAGYEPGNLRWACFACNKAKSNTFDETEMRFLGAGVALAWQQRLLAAGIETEWRPPTGAAEAALSETQEQTLMVPTPASTDTP